MKRTDEQGAMNEQQANVYKIVNYRVDSEVCAGFDKSQTKTQVYENLHAQTSDVCEATT